MLKLVMESLCKYVLFYFDLHLLYILHSANLNYSTEWLWMKRFVMISTITKLITSAIGKKNMAEQNRNIIAMQDGRKRMPQLILIFLGIIKIWCISFLLRHLTMYSSVGKKFNKTSSDEIFWLLMSINFLYNLAWGIYWIPRTIYQKIILPFIRDMI